MKVLVIGGGGREHAIVWKIAQSPLLGKLYCVPGNPGMAELAECVSRDLSDLPALAEWAKTEGIDFTVVGPEAHLADGIVDIFEEQGLKIFGPSKAAARLESSKSFAKEVMVAAGVQTAKAEVFTDYALASAYVRKHGAPIVIKADGLAAGKGVTVAMTQEQALAALADCLLDQKFGGSGASVVLEQYLAGREASVMAIIDGDVVQPLAISQDYKRLLDNNEGPNTGGMGAISPTPVVNGIPMETFVDQIFRPTITELKKRGIRYRGFLYAGVMVSPEGYVNVIEFNCRLGDPETEVLLPRLESDLLQHLYAATIGNLGQEELVWSTEAAACVVASSAGYPLAVEDGKEISGIFSEQDNCRVFFAGVREKDGALYSKGGRVLVVSALGKDVLAALDKVYTAMAKISFAGMHYRKDIGS
ncbi:MAG: phosphoribosylamine--glycine ligase [bacterium]|nr:phosphoribosylamine--glycine ligase [bacterium]